MYNFSKLIAIFLFTILLGYVFTAQMIVPVYAASNGQIHFFGHATSGKPTSYTSPSGFEIDECAPLGSSMIEMDLYLLNENGSPNTVRLTMFSGTDGENYPTSVTISSVDFYTETGISVGSENTESSTPFDVLVPPSGESSSGMLRAESDTHIHLKITFNANGDEFYQIHGDNIDANGKMSNGYFFYTDDPEICDNGNPPGQVPVGGMIIPIDTVSLMVTGAKSTLIWILPFAIGSVGLAHFMLRQKKINMSSRLD